MGKERVMKRPHRIVLKYDRINKNIKFSSLEPGQQTSCKLLYLVGHCYTGPKWRCFSWYGAKKTSVICLSMRVWPWTFEK